MKTKSTLLTKPVTSDAVASVKLPAPWYEKALLICGELFALWCLVTTAAETIGLWNRSGGEYRFMSALLGGALFLYLLALIFAFFAKLRLVAVISSFAAAVIGIWTGVELGSVNNLGYLNSFGQTFTETTPFWWGHIIPASIFVICLALWVMGRMRQKKEDEMYVQRLAEAARKKLGE